MLPWRCKVGGIEISFELRVLGGGVLRETTLGCCRGLRGSLEGIVMLVAEVASLFGCQAVILQLFWLECVSESIALCLEIAS